MGMSWCPTKILGCLNFFFTLSTLHVHFIMGHEGGGYLCFPYLYAE